jgi:cell division protein FtsX
MSPDTIIVVLVIAVATTLPIAGLAYIANQNRKMNDKMTADDASIFLQGRQVQEILREMRELLRSQT